MTKKVTIVQISGRATNTLLEKVELSNLKRHCEIKRQSMTILVKGMEVQRVPTQVAMEVRTPLHFQYGYLQLAKNSTQKSNFKVVWTCLAQRKNIVCLCASTVQNSALLRHGQQ